MGSIGRRGSVQEIFYIILLKNIVKTLKIQNIGGLWIYIGYFCHCVLPSMIFKNTKFKTITMKSVSEIIKIRNIGRSSYMVTIGKFGPIWMFSTYREHKRSFFPQTNGSRAPCFVCLKC